MALFRCPVCALPLTDAETLQVNCPACDGVLRPAADVPPAPAAAASENERRFAWLSSPPVLSIGGVAVAVLIMAAFLVGRWTSGPRAAVTDTAPALLIANAKPKPTPAQAEPEKPAAPSSEPKSERVPVSYPPLALARAKTLGDDLTDGDIGARSKPAGVPAPVEAPPAPRVADERPAPNLNPLDPFGRMPGFINEKDFGGLLDMQGGPGKQLEQLFKMANARNQELEKLFNQAGMQDLDLIRALDAFQGFPKPKGPGLRQPLPKPDEPAHAGADDIDELTFSGDSITDKHLEPLRNLNGLRVLSVAHTAVSDAGLAHLKGLKGLRRLFLANTAVTDRGLEHLQGMTELRELDLRNTRVTDAGVNRLQQVLPALKVTR